jgi:hypothetical protein
MYVDCALILLFASSKKEAIARCQFGVLSYELL